MVSTKVLPSHPYQRAGPLPLWILFHSEGHRNRCHKVESKDVSDTNSVTDDPSLYNNLKRCWVNFNGLFVLQTTSSLCLNRMFSWRLCVASFTTSQWLVQMFTEWKRKKKLPQVQSMWILFWAQSHQVVFYSKACFTNLTQVVRWRVIEPPLARKAMHPS